MDIAAGLILLGLSLWAAFWIAHEPFLRSKTGFGVIHDPPRWVRLLTGARERLYVVTLVIQVWAVMVLVVGVLLSLGFLDGADGRTATIVVVIGGGLLAILVVAVEIGLIRWRR
jgi:hypothetical protein